MIDNVFCSVVVCFMWVMLFVGGMGISLVCDVGLG